MKRYLERGFAMVQVMVAISAAAGMGYYLMSQQQVASRLHSKSAGQEVVDTASAVIKTALASSAICTKNVAGKKLNDNVPVILNLEDQLIAQEDQPLTALVQGIKLVSMKIKTYKDPVSNEVADYLYVVYDLDPSNVKKLSGSKTIGKKFRLRGKKNLLSQRYIFCYHEESNLVELSARKNCEEMRGVWNNWTCDMDMNQFVDTTPTRCPVGKLNISVPDSRVKTSCIP
jgi:hypothetical protein